MNNAYNYLLGIRIIEDASLTIVGDPIEVERSWKERLFSLPWRPWKKVKIIIPQVPDPHIYQFEGTMVMHPTIVKQIKENCKDRYSSSLMLPKGLKL